MLVFHSHFRLYQMFWTQLSCSYGLAFIMLFSKCLRYKGWFSIGFGCECGGLSKCACFIVIFVCIRCFGLS